MRRRPKDSGYALLLILLLAALVAISLYKEIPRIAFESQRQKEQLLMERGEQYKRAVQMFVSANKRWPAKIEDLENMNNRRYLRRRYKDPMTGKDEWRMIHIANGILTDSKVTKPPGQQGDQKQSSTAGQYVGEQAGIGQTLPGAAGATGVALATRKRASDGAAPGVGGPGGPGTPETSADPSQQAGGMPGQPGQQMSGQVPGVPPQPGQGVQAGMMPPGVPGMPGAPGQMTAGQIIQGRVYNPQQGMQSGAASSSTSSGSSYVGGGYQIGSQITPAQTSQAPQQPQYPGQGQYPGMPGQPYPAMQAGQYPGQPVNSQYQGVSPSYPAGISPGATPGYQQPGMSANPTVSDLIQRAVYGPRPGGAPTNPAGTVGGALIPGGGIAGFASNADAEGIMVYNDKTNYSEWEFVYDPAKVKTPMNPNASAATGATPVSQMGNNQGFSNPGTPVQNMPGANPGNSPFQTPQQPTSGFGGNPIRP